MLGVLGIQPSRAQMSWAALLVIFLSTTSSTCSSSRFMLFAADAFSPQAKKFTFLSQRLGIRIPSRDGVSDVSLYAKKKLSMAQKRKKRGKRLPPRKVERPAILDETKPVDAWDKTETTDEAVAKMKEQEDDAKAKAAELIETQRKSVDTLTLIKKRVEALAYDEIAESLKTAGYFVQDGFIGDDALVSELEGEGLEMFSAGKLDRDIANLDAGEFTVAVKGGQEQYADCPRSVEFIVSLTRHICPLLDTQNIFDCDLDSSASMGSLRVFDRNARESSLALFKEAPPPRPFEYVNGSDKTDPRKVTVMYFPNPFEWDEGCGGGVTFEEQVDKSEVTVEALRDRLLIFRSDTCLHRMDAWVGKEGLENGSCIVIYLIKKS